MTSTERIAPVILLDECPSTNALLKAMAREGAEDGTVLIARRQTEGRGRLGRSFVSPEGGVYLSMLLRPEPAAAERLPELSACAALAVRRALLDFGVEPGIKWPNDLLLQGKKICGILPETLVQGERIAVILGVGINLNTEKSAFEGGLEDTAASVSALCGREVNRESFIRALISALDETCGRWKQGESFAAEYRAACLGLGRELLTLRNGAGEAALALDICDDMSLLVRYSDGREESLRFGEVSLRGL